MNKLISTDEILREENNRKIFEVQNSIGFELNEEMKNLYVNYNVAKPLKTFFKMDGAVFNINWFFGNSQDEHKDFLQSYITYSGRMPDQLYPIGSVDGGDLLCMDKNTSQIYYWFHEEDDWGVENNEKWPEKVADNLDELVKHLESSSYLTAGEIRAVIDSSTITITPASVMLRNQQRALKGLPSLTLEEWESLLNNK